MTRNEIIDLLAMCAALDQRTVGEADVLAWGAVIGRCDFPDAQAAVVEHYAERTDRIMPAHVLASVRRLRAARLRAVEERVPDADPDDPTAYIRALREGRHRAADPAPDRPIGRLVEGRFTLPDGAA